MKKKPDKHVFVCINSRIDSEQSSCGEEGFKLRNALVQELSLYSCRDDIDVRINKSGCLNECEFGPTIVIYPQGFWYYNVTLIDINEIVQESIINNNYIQRLAKKEK